MLPWIWAVNGGTSVLGSALAILIAMNVGFRAALLTGAAAYALASGCVRALPRRAAERAA